MFSFLKISTISILSFLLISLASIYICNSWVINYSKKYIYSNTNNTPKHKVGLVLGASKLTRRGNMNLYFKYRIQKAVELYKAGKIEYIIVSGDNHIKSYNEPEDMQQELIKRGVPENRIYLDFAGFRTLDSVVRCNKIFGQSEFTIISQQFHNERAVFIARKKGLNVVGANCKNVPSKYSRFTTAREYLARVKVVIDLIIGKDPKFLGESIQIG